ncbi:MULTISPECIES: glycosyltransferase family 2 protein [Streptomyces]|uniref:glycosyltransferase family 2 protein n=1 Tax=Streptomyces TaxID=1883 RepID=UPI002248C4C3|nr:glycosyltransferase family 2 protein [Streptomyces sp. JHD 1]MCX2971127.1 glycosyltransferase family 2 protein [Streptomyces sp. JHD 1]
MPTSSDAGPRAPGAPRDAPAPRPTARYLPPGGLAALAALPLVLVVGWTAWHLLNLSQWRTAGPGLGLVWLVSFLLLWWLPLCWFERPATVTERQRRDVLDPLRVTVHIPVYNEDPRALRACVDSVLAQSRPVQRVRVVDDGSADAATGRPLRYDAERAHLLRRAAEAGIEATWDRTPNRGKRWAQMHVLADDDADVFVTLDSDSVLDEHAVAEGLKPFADPRVRSVAGLVAPLNARTNLLTRLTTVLYLPFTRGLRSAQSLLGSVLINSGTLAFYRADVVRGHAGVYERESFRGVPMQMNDDSMLTLYALLAGRTVHQPSAVVFTLVPDRPRHYFRQQLRWMRGTTVRHLWWLRHLPVRSLGFWMPVVEYAHLLLALLVPVVVLASPALAAQAGPLAWHALLLGCAMNYLIGLRLFALRRSDDRRGGRLLLFLCSPVAGLWRLLVLRPLYLYAMATCWRVGTWGTRSRVEVRAGTA